jgi:hypothetical protein
LSLFARTFEDIGGALTNSNIIATDASGNVYVVAGGIKKITAQRQIVDFKIELPAGFRSVDRYWIGFDAVGSAYVGIVELPDISLVGARPAGSSILKVSPSGQTANLWSMNRVVVVRFSRDDYPSLFTFDSMGNTFIAFPQENDLRLLKVSAEGAVVDEFLAVGLSEASAMMVDRAGVVVLADPKSGSIVKVNARGVLTTLTQLPFDPDAAPNSMARFGLITGLAQDAAGSIFAVDHSRHLVYRVNPGGERTVVVGTLGLIGNNPGSLPASLRNPWGIAIDSEGALLITTDEAVLKATLQK